MLDILSKSLTKTVPCPHADFVRFSRYFNIEVSDIRHLIETLDEWWFVPRSDESLQNAKIRIDDAVQQYALSGVLPDYIHHAALYVDSDRHTHLESILRTYRTDTTAL